MGRGIAVTTPMVGQSVRLEASDGGVRHLVLTAPERRNALTQGMLEELARAVEVLAADTDVRAVVVSAEGRAFCAGADVHSLFGDPNRPPAQIRSELKAVYACFLGLRDLSVPTIAAVDGAAVGAGVNIALACDVVVAGPAARFIISFADIGLHPGGGCSWFLVDRMGYSRALATVLGADSIDAEAAVRAGLATEQSEHATARALELAGKFAKRDPGILRDMKRALQIAKSNDLATTLEFESWAQASSVTMPAFQQYMSTFGR